MKSANYAVVQYTADPGRNEQLNLGIVVWSDRDIRVGIDDKAVDRVIRDHPRLDRDALRYVHSRLVNQLRPDGGFSEGQVREVISTAPGFPLGFSEPRYVGLRDDSPTALTEAYDHLLNRIVRPRSRSQGGAAFNPVEVLERRLRPFIEDHHVYRSHVFESSRSGVPRPVEFFANSGTNVAVDTLKLAITRADAIVQRADAQAFKVEDVLQRNPGVEFLVYCQLADDLDARQANEKAERILASGGATVLTNIDETGDRIEASIRRSRGASFHA